VRIEVPGADVLQRHLSDVREDMEPEARLIRPQVRDEALALLQPALGIAGQGDRAFLGLPELHVGGEPVLQAVDFFCMILQRAGSLQVRPIC
jgi:hypothetical protein